jgi:uncharacterized protein
MVTAKKKQVPVLEGAWTVPSSSREKPQLIGSECPHCGEIYFPRKAKSLCVHCQREGLKDIKLSRRGTINTFTIIMQQPGGNYYHGPVPYAIGVVELPEGVYVETPLKADRLEDLTVGMEVELVIEKIWEDQATGTELIGFKFQPV